MTPQFFTEQLHEEIAICCSGEGCGSNRFIERPGRLGILDMLSLRHHLKQPGRGLVGFGICRSGVQEGGLNWRNKFGRSVAYIQYSNSKTGKGHQASN